MADIAQTVDIKAPSIYKHFKGKQQIFDALLAERMRRLEQVESQLGIALMDQQAQESQLEMSEELLISIGSQLFDFLMHDSMTVRFRRMLALHQFGDPVLAQQYVADYMDAPMNYQGAFIQQLVEAGRLRAGDSQAMALAFYAPIFLLIVRCDATPSFEAQAQGLLKKHIAQFLEVFGTKGKEGKGGGESRG
jgi:AcrR family transcriptional regulator